MRNKDFLDKEMAIVTSHFNWCGFKNPKRNLHRFIRENSHLPLYGIELSLTNEFETTGIEGWTQIRVGWQNLCFQKEALINKLVNEIVPESFTKIAWIDADVHFSNRDWYKDACIALDYVKVIQLFDTAVWTNEKGHIESKLKAMAITGPKKDEWTGHSGFAFAANREMWNYGGLYSKTPVGSGDTIFIYSIFDVELQVSALQGIGLYEVEESEFNDYIEWKNKINSYVKGSVGYINGDCIHEWHGDKKNRRYIARKDFLEGFKNSYMFLNNKNILEFTADFPLESIQLIHKFFLERKEDG